MINNVEKMKKFLGELEKENIIFKPHFYHKIKDRPYLDEQLIIESLKNVDSLLGFQKQISEDNEKYRIGIKLSGNYDLVIIAEIKDKNLYIITAWKTSRKWQKSIQK